MDEGMKNAFQEKVVELCRAEVAMAVQIFEKLLALGCERHEANFLINAYAEALAARIDYHHFLIEKEVNDNGKSESRN